METESKSITLTERVKSLGVSMTVKPADSNPNADGFGSGAHHWRCTLKCGRSRITVPFSQGSAHTKPPTVEDVLSCLADDAAGLENASGFDDWADEYGYDTDSRKAERTYKAVQKLSAKLHTLLGDSGYSELLWNTERL